MLCIMMLCTSPVYNETSLIICHTQLGMSVLWWISGVGGLTRFKLGTHIADNLFLETKVD